MNYISFVFILVSFYNSQAQKILFPSLQGDQLLDKIVEEYKPETVLGYNDAKTCMFEHLNLDCALELCNEGGKTNEI